MTTTYTMPYINSTDRDQRLIIEPWAEEFVVKPGQQVEIVAEGGIPGEFVTLEQHARGLFVHADNGSIINVMLDGKQMPTSFE